MDLFMFLLLLFLLLIADVSLSSAASGRTCYNNHSVDSDFIVVKCQLNNMVPHETLIFYVCDSGCNSCKKHCFVRNGNNEKVEDHYATCYITKQLVTVMVPVSNQDQCLKGQMVTQNEKLNFTHMLLIKEDVIFNSIASRICSNKLSVDSNFLVVKCQLNNMEPHGTPLIFYVCDSGCNSCKKHCIVKNGDNEKVEDHYATCYIDKQLVTVMVPVSNRDQCLKGKMVTEHGKLNFTHMLLIKEGDPVTKEKETVVTAGTKEKKEIVITGDPVIKEKEKAVTTVTKEKKEVVTTANDPITTEREKVLITGDPVTKEKEEVVIIGIQIISIGLVVGVFLFCCLDLVCKFVPSKSSKCKRIHSTQVNPSKVMYSQGKCEEGVKQMLLLKYSQEDETNITTAGWIARPKRMKNNAMTNVFDDCDHDVEVHL